MASDTIPLPFEPFYSPKYHRIRFSKAFILASLLNKYTRFKKIKYDQQVDIIIRIENSCSNETIRKARGYNLRCDWENPQFINIYNIICYSITSVIEQQLKSESNIVDKILDGDVNVNIIASMSCKELSPQTYEAIIRHVNKRVDIEQTVKYTEMYDCKKCKRNKTTAERIQNRSNDEASSFFITCLFCGARWFL